MKRHCGICAALWSCPARRLLRSVAKGESVTQDTSTLENPAILEQLGQAY